MKLVAEPIDLVPTDGNLNNRWSHSMPKMKRTSPAWHETELQDVENNHRSCIEQVSKGKLMKLLADPQDLVPTVGNLSNNC
jgi:hypothetical protein